jgi:O-antigen/teichoic acid export membrane protein
VISCFKFLLVYFEAGVQLFALALVLEVALVAIALSVLFLKSDQRCSPARVSIATVKLLWKGAVPLLISSLLVAIMMSVDKMLLMWVLGPNELGIYAVAYMIFGALYFLPVAVGGALVPHLSELYLNNRDEYYSAMRKVYLALTLGSFALAFVLSWLSPLIIALVFGDKYDQSASLFSVLVWGIIGVSIVSIRGRLLIIEERQRYVPVLMGLGIVVYLVLLWVLVDGYGAAGAAYAVAVSWIFNAFVLPFCFVSIREHAMFFVYRRGQL